MTGVNSRGYELNRISEHEKFHVSPGGGHTVESFVGWIERGAFFYDADYQRDYVWKKKQQQEFLFTLISGFPLGSVAIAKRPDWLSVNGPWMEVVDGKQRIMTIEKFVTGEIPIILKGRELWWHEMTRPEHLAFGRPFLPMVTLENATKQSVLDYFIAVNFTGVPQSTKHKNKVLAMREELK